MAVDLTILRPPRRSPLGTDADVGSIFDYLNKQQDILIALNEQVNGDFTAVNGQVGAVQQQVATVEGNVQGLDTTTGGLADRVASLETQLNAALAAITDLQGKLAAAAGVAPIAVTFTDPVTAAEGDILAAGINDLITALGS